MSTKADSNYAGPVTIFHNPRCSKSRAALELLRIRGNQLDVIEYLQHPPSPDVLKDLVQKLDVHPRELIRAKERQAAGLPPTEDEDEIIEQIVQNPSIMQRPIVVAGERACVARPPERLLEILRRQ